MKKKTILMLIFIALILIFSISSYRPAPKEFVEDMTSQRSEDFFFIYETTRYPSNVEITEEEKELSIGVTVDPWNLNFGMIPTGGHGSRRFLILENLRDKDAKVRLEAYGDISPMVSFSKNNFIFHKNENTTIEVILQTTNDTIPGSYSGEIDVIIKIPKYDFIQSVLGWI